MPREGQVNRMRNDVGAQIVGDLGEAIDGFLEAGVVAVDEDQRLLRRDLSSRAIKFRPRLVQVHAPGRAW